MQAPAALVALAALLPLACHAPAAPPRAAADVAAPPRPPARDECDRACDRFVRCATDDLGADADAACRRDCRATLAPADALAYAVCLEALACPAVRASLTMNEGPAGRCYPRRRR